MTLPFHLLLSTVGHSVPCGAGEPDEDPPTDEPEEVAPPLAHDEAESLDAVCDALPCNPVHQD